MTLYEKKTLAKRLFISGHMDQTHICENLQITNKTMCHWVAQLNWKAEKEVMMEFRTRVINNLYQEILDLQENSKTDNTNICNNNIQLIISKLQYLHTVEIQLFKTRALALIFEFSSFCYKRGPEIKVKLVALKKEFLVKNFIDHDTLI
jgi:hypothetical protein